jgi:hypothetical protein
MLSYLRHKFSARIDSRLAKTVGARLVGFQVYSKEFPPYRFVDLYNAVEAYGQLRRDVVSIQSEHEEDLNAILNGKGYRRSWRKLKKSTFLSWPSDYDQERSLPVDCFWVCPRAPEGDSEPAIIRLRFDYRYGGRVHLEAASPRGSRAERSLEIIVSRSIEQSVYRNKVLELAYETGTKDAYGDVERPSQLRVLFKVLDPVDDDDIIIGEQVKEILWRNIIDLHQRREILKAHHVPVRRGVLLYGPPGTGKTFACRYLCGKLPNATRIIVTGSALHQVNSIFTLARLLQPSLVILEDVDLVFSSREINLYSSVLGDMLDQMDGLRPFEDIGFVLTTNAIDRMEAAIKDRPGRISQCIHFGAPEPELRRRYLSRYLRHYQCSNLDVDLLVRDSKGATQAFLKEWVHRSVQIALERFDGRGKNIEVSNEDFKRAMAEMRSFSEGETGRIIGFHSS